MKVALVGVGQAGGKVVDAMLSYADRTDSRFVAGTLAVNSAEADLLGLRNVPVDRRLLIGQSRVKGHGCGADNELGVAVVEEDVEEVLSAVSDVPAHEIDAFLVVAGLGGGTGSGGAPVVARELKRMYTEPVYGLGVLPGSDEGGIYTLNAARSFRTFVREVDNLLVYDNDAARSGDGSLRGGYAAINDDLARRLGVLFSAGETDGSSVPESVVDSSEIINTLAGGGVSTVGYAATPLERAPRGLFGRREEPPDSTTAVTRVTSTVRKAVLGGLTLPVDAAAAERALVVVSGPPAHLNRRGIEEARRWLEEQTGSMEVRGGDYPVPDSDYLASVVVLSGVSDVPRIEELRALAVEAKRRIDAVAAEHDALDDLGWGGEGGLDPLF
jgi:cell division GTPase FtsZ